MSGNFPEGQIMDHGKAEGIDERTAKDRFSSEEKRALDRLQQDIYQEIRHAAEAHRQVSQFTFAYFYYCTEIICLEYLTTTPVVKPAPQVFFMVFGFLYPEYRKYETKN